MSLYCPATLRDKMHHILYFADQYLIDRQDRNSYSVIRGNVNVLSIDVPEADAGRRSVAQCDF